MLWLGGANLAPILDAPQLTGTRLVCPQLCILISFSTPFGVDPRVPAEHRQLAIGDLY